MFSREICSGIIGLSASFLACTSSPSESPTSKAKAPTTAPLEASQNNAASVALASGFREIQTRDPLTSGALPLMVFYPGRTLVQRQATAIGPYLLEATHQPPKDGRFPLIVVSHGHGGDMLGHHDLCTTLAALGYIVVAPEHVGDSHRDPSGFGTERVLLGRALQVSAAIDAILQDAEFAPLVDAHRIGIAGFSAGGYTSLLSAGAIPDFSRIQSYCQRYPEDPEFCAHDLPKISVTLDRKLADPRIRAAFVMAPVGVFFAPGSMRDVHIPIYLVWATEDRVLIPEENAAVVRREIPKLAGEMRIDGAGHFVFLAPCTAAFAAIQPSLCQDPPGVDREAIHQRLGAAAHAFFQQAW